MISERHADPVRDLLASEFDAGFYQAQVERTLDDPLGHFMTEGWRAGLDPCPDFSTRFYLERSPDVRRADMNPFHHYLGWGRREGRAPNPSAAAAEPREEGEVEETIAAALDTEFYFSSHPELALQHVDPVRHYIAFGHDAGFNPTPEFDTGFYLSRSPDVAAAGMNGFHHYLRWGRYEGRAPNAGRIQTAAEPATSAEHRVAAHVDAAFYRLAHPDAVRTHVEPFKHYLHFGWHAGLDPSAGFSTRFYLSAPYETAAHENPLHHYLRVGRSEGRLPRPLFSDGADHLEGAAVRAALRPHFDVDFYRAAHSDQLGPEGDPLSDYIEEGWRAGRDPAPWFSTGDYLRRFPGVAAQRVNPFLHYLLWGRDQGFPTSDGDGGGAAVLQDPAAGIVSAELRPIALRRASPARASKIDPSRLDLHWIIPDIEAPGRGGHMTILRMVRWLEAFGHRCTLWINDPNPAWTEEGRRDLIQRSYQAVSAEVRSLPDTPEFPPDAVVIATSWTTALVVDAIESARNRFYFVQDDERAFHAAGAKALAAERTYRLDMGYLCAGPWLAEMLARDHGRWARSFDLCPDDRQFPPSSPALRDRPRIAFYARRHTERRAVELGFLGLELLAENGVAFEAHLFGSEERLESAPFPAIDHGVLSPEALAELYGDCDLGLCFSATNHSLIPQEMMACGLPVVELDGESTRAVFPAGVATLAPPDPREIAAALAGLLHDPERRRAQAERAQAWVSGRSWEHAARAVEAAILERLGAPSGLPRPTPVRDAQPAATVVIPTLDGGPTFQRVLDQVLAQSTAWPFEVVVVDSGSDDGTWELLQSRAEVRSFSIPRSEFQHGRTRNLAAAHGSGEFLVFITQDAEPADRLWLGDLVGTLQRHPRAAGVFGRHLPRPEASPFTKRDLQGFFRHLDGQPLERSKFWDLERWRSADPVFRRELHFFSNNNACLRRSVWRRRPFPEVEYGEDQVWAARILSERYPLIYAPRAAVIHSHDYDPASRYERSRVEGRWFRDSFGYDMTPADPEAAIARMNAGDARWGVRNGVSAAEIEAKQRLNRAEIAGLVAGQRES